MKKTNITFYSACCFAMLSSVVKADVKYDNLQKQIDELNKKIETKKTINFDDVIIKGRLAILGNFYSNDAEIDENLNGLSDKFSVKTARLTIIKPMGDFLFYFEGNFNGNKARLGQNFINYSFNKESEIRVGQVATPGFMENEKNANMIAVSTFSPWLNYLPGYLIGVNYLFTNDTFGITTGFFGNGSDQEGILQNDTHFTFAFRSFYTPVRNNNVVIHLGFDTMYRDFEKDSNVNSSEINDNVYYGLELGIQYKTITFESEFLNLFTKYNKNANLGNDYFSAFGLTTQLIVGFTGDKRIYDKFGSFGFSEVKNPVSKGGIGAIEGVLKFSRYDGEDKKEISTVDIGTGYEFTVGVNWFPIENVMFLLNYSRNQIKEVATNEKMDYDAYRLEARMFF